MTESTRCPIAQPEFTRLLQLDDDAVRRWSDHFDAPIGNDRLSEDDILEITRSSVEFTRYFLNLLDEGRRAPRDDFLTLLNGTDDPEEDVTAASRLSYVAQLLGAGNETSTKMIAARTAILARDHALTDELRHHYVGAPVGRAGGVIAFEVLLERPSNWTIADDLGGEDFERSYLLRGHRHLWIRW